MSQEARRAKTDHLHAEKLLALLVQHWDGGARWKVVRVPDEDQEDEGRLHRELRRLNQERTALRNRVHSLLATDGIKCPTFSRLDELSAQLRRWDLTPLPLRMQQDLQRLHARLQLVTVRIREVRKEQKRFFDDGKVEADRADPATHYAQGDRTSPRLAAGDGVLRVASVPQPRGVGARRADRFEERRARGSGRSRRLGIVALSRKLLVALWRFVDQGVVLEGALFKPAGAIIK